MVEKTPGAPVSPDKKKEETQTAISDDMRSRWVDTKLEGEALVLLDENREPIGSVPFNDANFREYHGGPKESSAAMLHELNKLRKEAGKEPLTSLAQITEEERGVRQSPRAIRDQESLLSENDKERIQANLRSDLKTRRVSEEQQIQIFREIETITSSADVTKVRGSIDALQMQPVRVRRVRQRDAQPDKEVDASSEKPSDEPIGEGDPAPQAQNPDEAASVPATSKRRIKVKADAGEDSDEKEKKAEKVKLSLADVDNSRVELLQLIKERKQSHDVGKELEKGLHARISRSSNPDALAAIRREIEALKPHDFGRAASLVAEQQEKAQRELEERVRSEIDKSILPAGTLSLDDHNRIYGIKDDTERGQTSNSAKWQQRMRDQLSRFEIPESDRDDVEKSIAKVNTKGKANALQKHLLGKYAHSDLRIRDSAEPPPLPSQEATNGPDFAQALAEVRDRTNPGGESAPDASDVPTDIREDTGEKMPRFLARTDRDAQIATWQQRFSEEKKTLRYWLTPRFLQKYNPEDGALRDFWEMTIRESKDKRAGLYSLIQGRRGTRNAPLSLSPEALQGLRENHPRSPDGIRWKALASREVEIQREAYAKGYTRFFARRNFEGAGNAVVMGASAALLAAAFFSAGILAPVAGGAIAGLTSTHMRNYLRNNDAHGAKVAPVLLGILLGYGTTYGAQAINLDQLISAPSDTTPTLKPQEIPPGPDAPKVPNYGGEGFEAPESFPQPKTMIPGIPDSSIVTSVPPEAVPSPGWEFPKEYTVNAGDAASRNGLDGFMKSNLLNSPYFQRLGLSELARNQFIEAVRDVLTGFPELADKFGTPIVQGADGLDLRFIDNRTLNTSVWKDPLFLSALKDNLQSGNFRLLENALSGKGGTSGLIRQLAALRV